MNLVLTGFMGTGKSAVGRILAARLGRRFVDTDAMIEARHGPIPAIFEELGEAAFRRFERRAAVEVARTPGLVVATGGRLLLDPVNARAIEATSRVFCLVAPAAEIVRRVTVDGVAGRPLLAVDDPEAAVARLLRERERGYARFEQVPTVGRTPSQVADAVLARW